ncbi:MAG: hypothetical protein IKX99_02715 [Lachnospiraceae bacterium]|nr:hypothetical protein [Lachnospiraceae bacterium]MBR4795371.1 hypothetical protein [Lachnospiraceae bacterium]MBR5789001.1 hypothetical protein [Lachnospiraceae bacterium]
MDNLSKIYEAQGKYITRAFTKDHEVIIYNPEYLNIEYGAKVSIEPSSYLELLAPLTIKCGATLNIGKNATLTVKIKTVLNDGDTVNVRESEEYAL